MNSKPFWQQFTVRHSKRSGSRKKVKRLPDNKVLLLSTLCSIGYLIFAIPGYYVLQININTIESLYLRNYSALITGLRHEMLVIKIAFILGFIFTFLFSLIIAKKLVVNSSSKLNLDFVNSNDHVADSASIVYRRRVS